MYDDFILLAVSVHVSIELIKQQHHFLVMFYGKGDLVRKARTVES